MMNAYDKEEISPMMNGDAAAALPSSSSSSSSSSVENNNTMMNNHRIEPMEIELSSPFISMDEQSPSTHAPSSPPPQQHISTSPPSTPPSPLRLYKQRWIQLLYLSLLALLSDWICFSLASNPTTFESHYHHSSSKLIDIFLFTNVVSSLLVTDVVARYGLRRAVVVASVLMAVGSWFRSGIGVTWGNGSGGEGGESGLMGEGVVATGFIVKFWSDSDTTSSSSSSSGTDEDVSSDAAAAGGGAGLVPYPLFVTGTILVGAAQPFFQCTPPLLSAQWFGANERATSTAVALNFNQIGIATAFLVGGSMGSTVQGLERYFLLISVLCTVVMLGTVCQFQDLPALPPSVSEWEKRVKMRGGRWVDPPFAVSARKFFSTKGFVRPLVAFICSIAVTNIVGAFIDEVLERGGITKRSHVAITGALFELFILLGGIIIGGYVDRTKRYKTTTLLCLSTSVLFLIPLGLTDHALGKEPVLLVLGLFALGLVVGPVQPISSELAVDVVYPGDEIAVESVQQIGGNLVSALLVPVAEWAAREDYQLLKNVPVLESDIRGDVVLLIGITVVTYVFYSGFDAPLRRTMADSSSEGGQADEEAGLEVSVFPHDHEEEEEDDEFDPLVPPQRPRF